MKTQYDNFVTTTPNVNNSDENIENHTESWHDPLEGLGNATQEKFYRMDSVVFAEPLNCLKYGENYLATCRENCDEEINDGSKEMQKVVDRRNYKHYKNMIDSTNIICPQPECNKTFSSMALLKGHIRRVHCAERNKYICERCGSGFPAKYLLQRHTAVHEMRKVECPVCHKMLSERTSLSVHLRTHANERAHECRVCFKRFVRKSTLTRHIRFVHKHASLPN